MTHTTFYSFPLQSLNDATGLTGFPVWPFPPILYSSENPCTTLSASVLWKSYTIIGMLHYLLLKPKGSRYFGLCILEKSPLSQIVSFKLVFLENFKNLNWAHLLHFYSSIYLPVATNASMYVLGPVLAVMIY